MHYYYHCDIVRVVDGDTIDVSIDLGFDITVKERVRLAGVDTPEVFGPNAVPEGKLASEFVKRWLAERETTGDFSLHSLSYNARDKYGRCLGLIYWEGPSGRESLVEAIIIAGHVK